MTLISKILHPNFKPVKKTEVFTHELLKESPEKISEQSAKGFTLIELLITISTIVTLGTLSSIFLTHFISQNSVINTRDELAGEIRKAQIFAMTGRQNGNWGIRYDSNIITLYQGSSYSARNTALDENTTVNSHITISGLSEINFAKITGLPNATPSIVISNSTSSKYITLNSYGTVDK